MANERILVVEDESIVALDLENKLEERGYTVVGLATTGREAVKTAVKEKPDLVLMDIKLDGDMDGIDAAREILTKVGTPVVYLTAFADEKILKRAKVTEPGGYIVKPYLEDTLHATIQMALARSPREQNLKWQVQWFTHGLNFIDSGMLMTDAHGKVSFMNMAGKSMAGWANQVVSGKRAEEVLNLISVEDKTVEKNPLRAAIRENRPVSLEKCLLVNARTGKKSMVSVHAEPIQSEQKAVIGAVSVFRNLKQRKKGETVAQEAGSPQLTAKSRNNSIIPKPNSRMPVSGPRLASEKPGDDQAEVIMEQVEMSLGECEVYLTVFRDALRKKHENAFEYLAEPLLTALSVFHSYYFDIVDLKQRFPDKDFSLTDTALFQLTQVFSNVNLALEAYIWEREKKLESTQDLGPDDAVVFNWRSTGRQMETLKQNRPALQKLRTTMHQNTGKILLDLKHAVESENIIKHAGVLVENSNMIKAHPIRGLAILIAIAVIAQQFEVADSLFNRLEQAGKELDLLFSDYR